MRSVIVVCVGVALALCGWFLFAHDDTPPPMAPAATPAAAAPAVASPATGTAAPADASEATAERTSAPVAENTSEQPPLPDDATWLEVLVVDKATQQPVAGADARWTDETQWTLVQKLLPAERNALYGDGDAMAERFGWRGRSDKDGKLRITLGKNGTSVIAREGGRYGSLHFARAAETPAEGHRILLAGDTTLRVRVLDHAGRAAAGVPLCLLNVEADGKVPAQYHAEKSTGEDGVATFRHVQGRQVVQFGPVKGKAVAQWAVRIAIPQLDVAPALVDAQTPPVEPVEVKLPPTGRLAVRMTFEGRPVTSLEQLSIHCGPKEDHMALNSAWSQPLDADGIARFGYVPLGKTFFVGSMNGGYWNFEVQGPHAPDQEVSTSIELAGEVIALAGRLLEGDGTPLADQHVGTQYELDITSGSGQVRTDAAGRFLWIAARKRPDAKREAKLTKLAFERQVPNASPQRVTVPPRDLVVGRNDLGELRFAVGALVVGGRFVFDTPGSSRTWFQVERYGERQGRPGSPVQWQSVGDLQIAVQDDGTFEARGTVDAGRYRINVQANGHLPVDPVEFVPGARDLQIDVRRGTPLQAKCRLPDGVEAQRIQLDLQAPGGAKPAPSPSGSIFPLGPYNRGIDPLRAQSDWGAEAGVTTYRWSALPPGTYSLRVGAAGFAEPFLTLADVVVPPPAGGDARLADLDLRSSIGTLRVRVRLPQGTDARRGDRTLVFPQPQADDAIWLGWTLQGGEAVLPVPKRAIDLVFASRNCRPVTVRGAVDAVDVTLEAWQTVEVRFAGLEALPPGVTLSARTSDPNAQRRKTQYVSDFSSGGLDSLLEPMGSSGTVKDGVATVVVGDVVRKLTVAVMVERRGRSLKQVTPNEIAAGGPITVQLSPDEIRTLVEELKQPPPEKK